MSPRAHRIVPPDDGLPHRPLEALAATNVTPAGSVSVRTTSCAALGPAFEIVIRYENCLVLAAVLGPLSVRRTSARVVPLPSSGIPSGLVDALLGTTRVADRGPAAPGVKPTS